MPKRKVHFLQLTVAMPHPSTDKTLMTTVDINASLQRFLETRQPRVWRQPVERRLQRDMELRKQYSKFMIEYLSLGHMRKLGPEECNTSAKMFYMPHRPEKKVRVVFDGSFEDVNGHALYDALHIRHKCTSLCFRLT